MCLDQICKYLARLLGINTALTNQNYATYRASTTYAPYRTTFTTRRRNPAQRWNMQTPTKTLNFAQTMRTITADPRSCTSQHDPCILTGKGARARTAISLAYLTNQKRNRNLVLKNICSPTTDVHPRLAQKSSIYQANSHRPTSSPGSCLG